MVDRIKVIGPVRDWVPDTEDPEDGEIFPGYWQRMVFVEATGTDGMVYAKSYAYGDSTPEEVIPLMIDFGKQALQKSMEEDGVW